MQGPKALSRAPIHQQLSANGRLQTANCQATISVTNADFILIRCEKDDGRVRTCSVVGNVGIKSFSRKILILDEHQLDIFLAVRSDLLIIIISNMTKALAVFRSVLGCFPLLAVFCGTLLAAAAEAQDLFSLSLEELLAIPITSATRSSHAVTEIPASVTILTREEIEALGYASLGELLGQVPGFYTIDDTVKIDLGVRGNIGAGIAFLLNGTPHHDARVKGTTIPERSRLNLPVESIDRIEIIRGPMSVVYGNNAFLGSINIVTNDIDSSGSRVSGSAGEAGGQGFARYAFRDSEKGAQVVANLGWRRDDGPEGDYSEMSSLAQYAALVRPGMRTNIDGYAEVEEWNFDLAAEYQSFGINLRYSEIDAGALWASGPPYDEGNPLSIETLHLNGFANVEWSEAFGMKVQVTYSSEDMDATYDMRAPDIDGSQFASVSRLNSEVIFNYKASDRIAVVSGLQHQRLSDISNIATINLFRIRYDRISEDVNSSDVFLDLDFEASERWQFFAGVRGTHVGAYRVFAHDEFDDPEETTEIFDLDARNDVTWRAAILHSFDENHLLKFMYGTATQDNRAADLIEPENIRTGEINYLYAPSDWMISISVFWSEIENLRSRNLRVGSTLGSYIETIDNSAVRETAGIEMIASWRPTSSLSFEASSVWQETRDTYADDVWVGSSPRWLAKLKAIYRLGDFTGSLTLNYVGSMLADHQRNMTTGVITRLGEPVDGYLLVGANLRYRHPGDHWYLNLHASNLFDAEVRYPASEYIVMDRGLFGIGRRMMLTAGYTF